MSRRKTAATPALAAVLLLAAMVAAGVVLPAPAAATAYRYWTYFTSTSGNAWAFSQVGPATTVPRHGAVEGWRFALSTGTRSTQAQPRIAPGEAFARFCGATAPERGSKRVAIVFDFGQASDAPPGQSPPEPRGTCVELDAGATGAQVLSEAADVRVSEGLVCAIGGYPAGECAPAVASPTPSPSRTKKDREPTNEPARPAGKDGRSVGDRQDNPSAPQAQPTSTPASSPSATPTRSPRRSPSATPSSSSSAPATAPSPVPSPTVPTTTATAQPVFQAADAKTDAAGPTWLLAAAAVFLVGLSGILLLRRRR